MSVDTVNLYWERKTEDFQPRTYNRTLSVSFKGGTEIFASTKKEYFGDPTYPNPEELLVSAASSCYMLTFLAYASQEGYTLDSYKDAAQGITGKNEAGKTCVTHITLNPIIKISGDKLPTDQDLERLKLKALDNCFISHSVSSLVKVNVKVDH